MPNALLCLANNSAITNTFRSMRDRFDKLYKRRCVAAQVAYTLSMSSHHVCRHRPARKQQQQTCSYPHTSVVCQSMGSTELERTLAIHPNLLVLQTCFYSGRMEG
jgi:hypothetical protein